MKQDEQSVINGLSVQSSVCLSEMGNQGTSVPLHELIVVHFYLSLCLSLKQITGFFQRTFKYLQPQSKFR